MLCRLVWSLATVGALAAGVTGCSADSPSLPAPDATAFAAVLSGTDGQKFLSDISTHEWPDGGTQAGQRFDWIAADTGSTDPVTATRAGRTAQVLASFLADDYDSLAKIPLGQRNPNLVRAYAGALTPYQMAMVSPTAAPEGFEALDPPGGLLPRARKAFALIDTDTQAGQAFTDTARQHARDLVARYARVVEGSHPAPDTADLDAAASLYAVADAAASQSGNPDISRLGTPIAVKNDAYWVIANTLLPQKPAPDPFPAKFFDADGQLRNPRDAAIADPSEYLRYLESYVRGFPDLAPKLHVLYDQYVALNGLS